MNLKNIQEQLMSKRNQLISLIIDSVIVVNFIFLAFSLNAYAKTALTPYEFGYKIIDPLTYIGIVIVFSYPIISRLYAWGCIKRKQKRKITCYYSDSLERL
jgi:predicted permease